MIGPVNVPGITAAEFNQHVSNTRNPHKVDKTAVGLGNVPNVATNDQTPTYTISEMLTNLESGEKLSISMGKIMKAIAVLQQLSNDVIDEEAIYNMIDEKLGVIENGTY